MPVRALIRRSRYTAGHEEWEPVISVREAIKVNGRAWSSKVLVSFVIALVACQVAVVSQGLPVSGVASAAGKAPETGKTKITFMTHYVLTLPFGKVLDQAIQEYERLHPNIQIDVQFVPVTELLPKILVAQSTGIAPDVVSIAGYMLGDLAEAGMLQEVPSSVRQIVDDVYLPGLSVFATYGGKQLGLTTEFMPRAMVANVRMLEAAGLPSRTPATFGELEEWARKLTQKEPDSRFKVAGYAIETGSSGQAVWGTIFSFAWSNGGRYLTPDYRRVAFNTPEVADAVNYLAGLVSKGIAVAKSWVVVDMRSEKAALSMAHGPYWKNEFTRPKEYVYDRFITGLMPAGKTGKPAAPTYGWLLGVTTGSSHSKEAWEFITWLTTSVDEKTGMTRMGQVMAELGSMPVTRPDLAHTPVLKEPFMSGFLEAIRKGFTVPDPVGPKALQLQNLFMNEIVPAILGTRSTAEALERAAQLTQAELDKIFTKR